MKYRIEELISADELAKKVKEIGARIEKEYAEADEIILVGLLRGSTIFLADLARVIDLDSKIDFMVVSGSEEEMAPDPGEESAKEPEKKSWWKFW